MLSRFITLFSAIFLGLFLSVGVAFAARNASNQSQDDPDPADSLLIGTPFEDLHGITDAGALILVPGDTISGLVTTSASLWTQDNLSDTPETDDELSEAMVSGDFNGDGWPDLAVGVPHEDYEVTTFVWVNEAGAVNVIYGGPNGMDTGHQQFFTQNDTGLESNEVGDHFGATLATGDFDGDGYDDLAIGAPSEDEETDSEVITDTGTVLVVYGSHLGLSFSHTGRLFYSVEVGDAFGSSLAAGDFDNDGYDDLIVGIPNADVDFGGTTVADAGMIDVWDGNPIGLWDGACFMDGNPEDGDGFGAALAAGDFNGDGYDDAAIGTPQEDVSTLADAGAITIMYGSNFSGLDTLGAQLWWQSLITDSNGNPMDDSEADDHFGSALAVGDFNGDGYDDLTIGTPDDDYTAFTNKGVVQNLNGTAGGLVTNNSRIWYGYWSDCRLGASLTAGDFNGDGYDDFAAGMPGESIEGQDNAGGVYVYYSDSTQPDVYPPTVVHIDSTDISGTAAEANDSFGATLATLPVPAKHIYLPLVMR